MRGYKSSSCFKYLPILGKISLLIIVILSVSDFFHCVLIHIFLMATDV